MVKPLKSDVEFLNDNLKSSSMARGLSLSGQRAWHLWLS